MNPTGEPTTGRLDVQQIASLLESLNYMVVVLNAECRITHLNGAGERLLGCARASVVGREASEALPDLFGEGFRTQPDPALPLPPIHFERYLPGLDLWVEVSGYQSPCGLLLCTHDITERKIHERVLAGQKNILEMVATGAPLGNILDQITTLISDQSANDLCTILLLSEDGRRLHCASVKSLPDAYNAAVEGAEIGPAAGSCGTAAFTRQRVIATDIATDPRWTAFADVALSHGLRACWSQPILARDGHTVLGSVANYSLQAGPPKPRSLLLLEIAAHLAQIAIEQAASEEVLRRHSLAYDHLYDGIVLTDLDGRIIDWNPAAERMFGYPKQEAVGKDVSMIDASGEGLEGTGAILQRLRGEGQWRGEINFRRKDHHTGVCETIVVPLKDRDGKMIATVGVNHDITERKRAECHLAAEAAVARILVSAGTIAEALPAVLETLCTACGWESGAIWMPDPEGGVIRCRELWCAPHLQLDEFVAATLAAAFTPGQGLPGRVWATARPAWVIDVRTDENFMRRAIAGRAGLRSGLAFPVMLDGKVIAVIEFLTPDFRKFDAQLDAMFAVVGGQIAGFIHRRNAEEQIKAARDAAETANKAKDRFFAVLSHELRTPLSPALLLATSMAADESLSPEIREDARLVRRSIELQTRLIDDLLDLSRIENCKLTLDAEPLDVHQLVLDCVGMCRPDAAARDIRLVSDLAAIRHVVRGDPHRLQQVHCNLLRNAIKFTPPGGQITIESHDAGNNVSISITDTGIGADPRILGTLFNPFEQAGRARESKGLGLGLAICKGLVEAHHGSIKASSEGPGRGMRMTVSLPTVSQPAPAKQPVPSDEPRPRQTPITILLVDDHADTLRTMSRLLQRLEHKVITADCVRSALAAAENNAFDLLISDVGLPDGTGTALIQELMKRRPVKGIALTGYGMESDVRQTRDAGFFAHLTKPVDFDKLLDAILQGTRM